METQVPNTPSELIQKNREPLSPEVIWEEFGKMSVEDQEKFLWNGVRVMKEFHQFVVKKNTEDGDTLKESGLWVVDGVKWEMMFQLMDSMMS